jgi:FADH2 O2-dependent halogenase
MKTDFDIAIVGSGFGGSLLAMIARRLGRSVVMIERGKHPRFAIGESSTPLANLLLEELARRYDLPEVATLTKWGTWQKNHPEIACGLKRGFTFYHHKLGQPWSAKDDRSNELLVAASPSATISDTHWYRPDFDHFLVREAQKIGVEYLDETSLHDAQLETEGVTLRGDRHGQPIELRARFTIDASGPHGFLHRALGLGEAAFPHLPPTEALYTHFTGVERWDTLEPSAETPPYPVDDAALHHVFEGGWMWVLRFNNGLTSAGVAATSDVAKKFRFADGDPAWRRLLDTLPSAARQFANARATRPFIHTPKLSFRTQRVAGQNWALLPSAAGFVDPLLSNGFPLTLLGIERLAHALEMDWGTDRFAERLATYEAQTLRELDITADLVGALYASMGDFEIFSAVTMLYFAAAMAAETRRRLGTNAPPSFLLESDASFGPALRDCLRLARERTRNEAKESLLAAIQRAVDPINLARLGDASRRNWYPCLAGDLLDAAPKLGVGRDAIERLLARCGFAGTSHVS